MGKCHICGAETEYECRDCGEYVCDNCTMSYNQFTQIDYTLCKVCGGAQEDSRANEYVRQEQEEKDYLKEKLIKNEKQRAYYHSESAVKKRQHKKNELRKLRMIQSLERTKLLSEIFSDIFKHI